MTENELTLLNLIREQNHPEKALLTALTTICWFLTRSQSFATPSVADFQELA